MIPLTFRVAKRQSTSYTMALLHAFERLEHVVTASKLFAYYAKELKSLHKDMQLAALHTLEVLAAVPSSCAKTALDLFTKLSKEALLFCANTL